jgi:hypothetical protein
LQLRFRLFHAPDAGPEWTLMQQARKFFQAVGRSDGIDLHSAIVLIPNPAAQPKAGRISLNKPSESDSLHPAGDKPQSRRLGRPAQDSGSPAETLDSRVSFTEVARSWGLNGLVSKAKPRSTTYRWTTCRSS